MPEERPPSDPEERERILRTRREREPPEREPPEVSEDLSEELRETLKPPGNPDGGNGGGELPRPEKGEVTPETESMAVEAAQPRPQEFIEETRISPAGVAIIEERIATEAATVAGRNGGFTGNPGNPGPQSHAPLTEQEMHNLKSRLETLERRMEVVEEQEASEPWHGTTMDFLPQMEGSPGIIVDEGVARATPCTRFDLGEESELVFSKGVVGALDEGQKALFCPETVTKPLTPEQEKRLRGWRDSADTCKQEIAEVPKGDKLEPWLTCMSRELKAQGIAVK